MAEKEEEKNRFECVVNCTRKSPFSTIKHNILNSCVVFQARYNMFNVQVLTQSAEILSRIYFAKVIIMTTCASCFIWLSVFVSLFLSFVVIVRHPIERKCSTFNLFAYILYIVNIECDFMCDFLYWQMSSLNCYRIDVTYTYARKLFDILAVILWRWSQRKWWKKEVKSKRDCNTQSSHWNSWIYTPLLRFVALFLSNLVLNQNKTDEKKMFHNWKRKHFRRACI